VRPLVHPFFEEVEDPLGHPGRVQLVVDRLVLTLPHQVGHVHLGVLEKHKK